MLIHGNLSVNRYITQIDLAINQMIAYLNIKDSLTIIFRVIIGLSVAMVGSLCPAIITPIFIFISIVLLYITMQPVQEKVFELTAKEKYFHVAIPFYMLFLLWASGVTFLGFPQQIMKSIGPMVILVAVAIWPIFISEKAYLKKQRKVPYHVAYAIFSVIVFIQQIFTLGGTIT